jgi:hypothetical protein
MGIDGRNADVEQGPERERRLLKQSLELVAVTPPPGRGVEDDQASQEH